LVLANLKHPFIQSIGAHKVGKKKGPRKQKQEDREMEGTASPAPD